jgi:hypothetical protein
MVASHIRPAGPMLRAQGATEYLILLSAVLIVALVVIALIGALPDSSYEFRSTSSNSYWRTQAIPFAVLDHSLSSDGVLTLSLMNTRSTIMQVVQADVSGSGMDARNAVPLDISGPLDVEGGRRKNLFLSLAGSCVSNQAYELNLNLTYLSQDLDLPAQREIGQQPLIGHCGPNFTLTGAGAGGLSGLPNGAPCFTPNDCQSHHCHEIDEDHGGEGTKVCVECIGNGHCSPPNQWCVHHVCQDHKDDDD